MGEPTLASETSPTREEGEITTSATSGLALSDGTRNHTTKLQFYVALHCDDVRPRPGDCNGRIVPLALPYSGRTGVGHARSPDPRGGTTFARRYHFHPRPGQRIP